ncbi:MAG: SWIM zinc finger family protein [Promethearchaeota archaeon]
MKLDNRKKEFLEGRKLRRNKTERPTFKTEREKQETREEVEQIKRNLLNFASTSWGKKWIKSNLKIGRPFRMQRGIEYVKDQTRIDNISIGDGQIFGTVQGTAPTPYRVKIIFDTIPEEVWQKIIIDLTKKTLNLIELLNGIMPEDINDFFSKHGFNLFPDAAKGLNATCSCPDTAIPCKHIAAIILYLARVLDFNPFLLLELHGKSKREIFNDLKFSKLDEEFKIKTIQEMNVSEENVNFDFNKPKILIQELTSGQINQEKEFKIGFKYKKPGKVIEILENLGMPQTIDNKAFEIVLKSIYNSIKLRTYEMVLGIE